MVQATPAYMRQVLRVVGRSVRSLAGLAVLLLAGCGGGSSSPAPSAQPLPVSVRHDLQYGYFGTVAGQLQATAAHISFVHAVDWGNWDDPAERAAIADRIIAQLQEARARGVPWSIVSTGFLTFDSHYRASSAHGYVLVTRTSDSEGLTPVGGVRQEGLAGLQ